MQCTNYNNPLYNTEVTGFGLYVSDQEDPPNIIGIYPGWSFTVTDLQPRSLSDDITFDFYLNQQDSPYTAAVPIQTVAGISLEFKMG